MDILDFVFLVIAVLAGLITLTIELFRHVVFVKALIIAVGNGFLAYIVVAFGTAILFGTAATIQEMIVSRRK